VNPFLDRNEFEMININTNEVGPRKLSL